MSLTEISADIRSGKRTLDNYVHTEITKGTPFLFWVRDAEFEIQERKQSGSAKLTLSFNEVSLEQFYGGKEPFREPEGKIIFKRVKQCNETSVIYDH